MNVNKEQVKKLLGNGLTPGLVATTVGCDPSYISQLMADETFALEVAKIRVESYESAIGRDQKYDSLEDRLIKKLEDILPLMVRPRDVLDALTRINAMKRRGTMIAPTGDEIKTQIIQLHMPLTILQQFALNGASEVVQVGDRNLTNLPAATLMKSLEEKESENASQTQPIPRLSVKQAERSIITEDSI